MFSHKATSETSLFHFLLKDNAVEGLHGSSGPTNRSTGSTRKGARLPLTQCWAIGDRDTQIHQLSTNPGGMGACYKFSFTPRAGK